MPGSGGYRVQPVMVTDVAALAVRVGQTDENISLDAAGPETFRFVDLVRLIRDRIGARARIVGMPKPVSLLGSRVVGAFVGDVVLTRDEITELSSMISAAPPTCPTRFSDWLAAEAGSVGRTWSSELDRNYRRRRPKS